MSKFKRQTHFSYGFNFMGKRTSTVGEDLVTVLLGEDVEAMDGTPLQITGVDGDNLEVDVCTAGEAPDLILYSRVSDELTDFEWIMTDILRDEVKPGDPATGVLFKQNNIIKTRLADAETLNVEDEVEVGDVDTEDAYIVAGEGEVVGKVIGVQGEFVYIQLK